MTFLFLAWVIAYFFGEWLSARARAIRLYFEVER